MFTVELYAGIRRAVMVDGLSRREAAKRFGVHRNTITKMLQFSVPPGYRRRERPASKKLGPYMAWIDKVLEDDRAVHKRPRHTAHTHEGVLPSIPSLGEGKWLLDDPERANSAAEPAAHGVHR